MRLLTLAAAVAVVLCAARVTDAQPPAKKVDPKADPKVDPKAKADEPKFKMTATAANIALGTQLTGAKLQAADLKGKVVVVDFWGVSCAPCLAAMPATAAMYAELNDFGLVVIGSHVQEALPDQIKSVAAGRGANFPLTIQTRVTGADDFQFIPHVIVFDHTGKCVFRGDPQGAEHAARVAVGEMIVAGAAREKFSSQLAPVVAELKKGQSPAAVLPKLVNLQGGAKDAAADAKALLASATALGEAKLEAAKKKADTDPVDAFNMVEKLPTTYKGTAVAKQATELVAKLKKDKAVTAELAARPTLEQVKKLEAQLIAALGADTAGSATFQKANAAPLKQLRDKVAQMKKSWPDAKATQEALAVAENYAPAGK